jgi:hypothetical protein
MSRNWSGVPAGLNRRRRPTCHNVHLADIAGGRNDSRIAL